MTLPCDLWSCYKTSYLPFQHLLQTQQNQYKLPLLLHETRWTDFREIFMCTDKSKQTCIITQGIPKFEMGNSNISYEMFPFQPKPVSASANSASAICFFTEYFLK